MMEERRKFVRLDITTDVIWQKIASEQQKDVSQGVTKNISGGGLCLFVDESVRDNDVLRLEISLPTKHLIKTTGKVVWTSDYEIVGGKREKRYEAGIEFLDISDSDREAIKKFVFGTLKE